MATLALTYSRPWDQKSYVRTDLGETRRIGFIANHIQANVEGDLQALISTTEKEDEEYLALDYVKLTSVLWSICRNLTARVEKLKEYNDTSNAQPPSKRRAKATAES